MILKRIVLISLLFIILLWTSGCDKFPAEQTETASEKQIRISNFKISPVSSYNCKVKVSFIATYKNFKTGKKPEMWWQIIGKNNYSSLGFRPLKKIKSGQRRIKIKNEELALAPTASCSGNCKVFFSVKDGEIRSNEIETICNFKK